MTRVRDSTGRLRYHGSGKRGGQQLRTAEVDLAHALESIEHARDLLRAGREAQGRERAELLAEARQRADLGARFVRAAIRGIGKRRAPATPKPSSQMRLPLGRR